jgi:hypothetical protein
MKLHSTVELSRSHCYCWPHASHKNSKANLTFKLPLYGVTFRVVLFRQRRIKKVERPARPRRPECRRAP